MRMGRCQYIQHVNYEHHIQVNRRLGHFHSTYALFLRPVIFCVRCIDSDGVIGERSQRSIQSNVQVALILLSMLALMVVGYAIQIGAQNPLQGSIQVYGQPYNFYFARDADWFSWTNPFVWPSFCWVLAAFGFLFNAAYVDLRDGQLVNMFAKGTGFRTESDFIQACNGVHYRRRFFIALICFPVFLVLPSSFVGGVTVLEPLKILLIVGLAGWVTQAVQTRRGDKWKMDILKWVRCIWSAVDWRDDYPEPTE